MALISDNTQVIRDWNKLAAKCLRSNDRFVAEPAHGFQTFRQRTAVADRLMHVLLPDPDLILDRGEILPGRGNSCRIAKVVIDGTTYVLKRYNRRGWRYSLRHVFRRSRAQRTWLAAWNFLVRGVRVAEPLLCLEERSYRLLGRSYVLMEYLEKTERLTTLWERLSPEQKQFLVEQAASLFGQLHRSGCIHGDTNWDNILLRQNESGFDFFLVDLDCTRIFSRVMTEKAQRDIGHFLRDLGRLEPPKGELHRRFVDCWRVAIGHAGA
ncbi:lipopolysaccharide kinase InaA family protein [Geobacter sp.]|uniref:lipopolysaccharide kinase InaA family protein n=1 Tax=Geobacter sp. TaxID=46610 RepID=UPI0027B9AA74|nr:lipopolysaccharide kinase InaA family protein [Geobacter sp.]